MEPSNEVPKRKRGRPLSKTGAMSVQSKDPVPSIPSTPEKGQTNQITKRRGRPPKNCASTPESSSFMNNGTSSTNNDAKRRIRPSVVPSSSVGREKETFVSKKGETPSSRNRLENVKEDYEIQKRGCKPRSVSVPPPNNAKANSKVNPKGNAKVERDLKRSLSREGVLSRQRKIKAPPKSSEFLEDSDDSHESSLVKSDSDQKIFLSRNQPLSRGRNERFPKNEVDNNNQFDVMPKVNRLRKPLQSDIKAFKVKKEQNDFSNKNFRGRPSSESNNKNKFDDAKGSSSTTLRKSNRSVSRGRQRRSSSESSSNETNLAQNFKKNSGKSQIRKLPIPRDLTRKRSSLKDNEGVDHSDERVTTVQRGTHLRNRSVSRGRPLSKSKAEDEKNKNSDTQDFTTKKRPEKTPLRSVSRGRQRRQTNEFVEDDNNPYQSKINMVNKMYHEIESRKSSSSEKRYGRLPSKNKSIVMTVDNKVERNRRSQTPKNQQETTETSTIKRKPSKMNKLNGLRKDPTSESLSTQKSNKKASTEMSSRITKGTQHSIKNFQNNPIKTVKKAYSEIPLESSSFNCEYTESESYSQKSNFPVKTGGKGKSSFESSPPFNESETETVPQTRLGGGLGKSIHLIPLVYYSNESESDSEFEFVHDNLDNLEFERIERIPVRGKRLFSLPPPQNNDLEIESPKELSSEEESLREKTDECTTTKIHESESELEVNSSISIVDKETTETLQKLKPERPLKNKMETNKQLQLDNSMNQVITDSEKSLDNQDLQLISKNSRNTQNNSGNLNMQMPMLIEHWSPSGIENGCKENSVDHYLYEPIERMEKKIDTMNQDDGSTELIEPSAVLWLNSTNNNNNEIVNAFRIGANDDLFIGNQFSMESSQLTSTINQDIPTESSITVPNEISLSEELSNLSNEIFDFSFFDSLLSSQENDFMDLDGNTL
ncbi:hypothetical protein Glove_42g34 [Diversispora epigaea]|uniref:Uncharacterized protein n=1 Tax=Diversispora epigaea TaxID=1348612 RepID=A0A397JPW8_9GLOM|nr:hypothetical protein Glove_42g34 [Diversispora epigaea]